MKQQCKCGKPLLVCPEYCSTCGQFTNGNKKMIVVGGVSKCIQVKANDTKESIQVDKQDWEKKLEKFIELGKELGFNNVDVYRPKNKLTAVTFSKSKNYINKISDII